MQRKCRGVKISDEVTLRDVTLRDVGLFKLGSLHRFKYRKKYLTYF
jgi:hypothetical protein